MVVKIKLTPIDIKKIIMNYCIKELKVGVITPNDIEFDVGADTVGYGMNEHQVYVFRGADVTIDEDIQKRIGFP